MTSDPIRATVNIALANGSFMRLDALGIKLYNEHDLWIVDALNGGPGARWWTSARLLLGLSDGEARQLQGVADVGLLMTKKRKTKRQYHGQRQTKEKESTQKRLRGALY